MDIREIIEACFKKACARRNVPAPSQFGNDLVLLQSGLDSLGFALLVTQLEIELGYDPFTLMDKPVYPKTFGEFVGIYDRFKSHAAS
jgi:hypothetical protein